MNWQALGTIAEMIGSLVVVATVIYLAIQTRQYTLAVQASVRQAMFSENLAMLFKQMDCLFRFRTYGKKELTDDQMIQLATWLMVLMRTRENYWLQYRSGGIDEALGHISGVLTGRILESSRENTLEQSLRRWNVKCGIVSAVNRHLEGVTAVPGFNNRLSASRPQ